VIRTSYDAPDTLKRPADWREFAACRGADDLMYPDSSTRAVEEAKAVCRRCPVIEQCLRRALETREIFGVWGGLDEKERLKILRRRGIRVEEPVEPKPPQTFESVWTDRHRPGDDGHIGWSGAVPVHVGGTYHTPQQISFRLDRGRPPFGVVRRTCVVDGCVHPKHLRDQRERDEARQAAVRAAVAV